MTATANGNGSGGSWIARGGAHILSALLLSGIIWLVSIAQQTREQVVEIRTRLIRMDAIEQQLQAAELRMDNAYADRAEWMARSEALLERVEHNAKMIVELRDKLDRMARQQLPREER